VPPVEGGAEGPRKPRQGQIKGKAILAPIEKGVPKERRKIMLKEQEHRIKPRNKEKRGRDQQQNNGDSKLHLEGGIRETSIGPEGNETKPDRSA